MKFTRQFYIYFLVLAALMNSQTAFAKPEAQMSCKELEQELASVDAVIRGEANAATGAHVAGAASAVGSHAAMVAGKVPFAGAIGGVFGNITQAKKQNAEQNIQQAQYRKSMLNGIYIGKGCTEPQNFAAPVQQQQQAQPQTQPAS